MAVLTENSVIVVDSKGNRRGAFEFDGDVAEYDFDGSDFLLLRLRKAARPKYRSSPAKL